MGHDVLSGIAHGTLDLLCHSRILAMHECMTLHGANKS